MARILRTLAVVAVLSSAGVLSADFWLYSARPFARDAWRNGDERQRARMISDLKDSGILQGRTRSDILNLLGQPDSQRSQVICYHFTRGSIIGDAFKLPFSDWMEWLEVTFDSDGRASRIAVND